MLNLLLLQYTFEISIVSFVICILLTDEYMILYRYYLFLLWLNRFNLQWLSYPLGYCEKCLGGQIALWFYIIKYGISISQIPELILFICITIFNITLIKSLWKKIQ